LPVARIRPGHGLKIGRTSPKSGTCRPRIPLYGPGPASVSPS
jgi:hypothetical protein